MMDLNTLKTCGVLLLYKTACSKIRTDRHCKPLLPSPRWTMRETRSQTRSTNYAKTFVSIHTRGINRLSVSPDGRYFAAASDDRTVTVFDLLPSSLVISADAYPRLIRQYPPLDAKCSSVVWGPGGACLFVGTAEGHIYLYERPIFTWVGITLPF